jgi:hypothetical protein
MSRTVAEELVETLAEAGVRRIYGLECDSGQAAPTAPLREIATLDAAISRWEGEGGAGSHRAQPGHVQEPGQSPGGPQIPEATRPQLNNQYVKPTDDRVRGTLENIGRTIIPTFNVRIGWLI